MEYSRKSSLKWILTYLIIGLFAYGAVYYFFFYKNGVYPENFQTQTQNNETADWKTYKNDEYGFEIKYPQEYTIKTDVAGLVVTDGVSGMSLHHVQSSLNEEIIYLFSRGAVSVHRGWGNPYEKTPDTLTARYFSGDLYSRFMIVAFAPAQDVEDDMSGARPNTILEFTVTSIISDEEIKAFQQTGSMNYDDLVTVPEEMLSTFKFTK